MFGSCKNKNQIFEGLFLEAIEVVLNCQYRRGFGIFDRHRAWFGKRWTNWLAHYNKDFYKAKNCANKDLNRQTNNGGRRCIE